MQKNIIYNTFPEGSKPGDEGIAIGGCPYRYARHGGIDKVNGMVVEQFVYEQATSNIEGCGDTTAIAILSITYYEQ